MSQRRFERDAVRRQVRSRRRAGLAAGAVGAAVLLAPGSAQAAGFTVDTLVDKADDGDCGPPDCTLREAIGRANATPGDDTITFASNVRGTLTLNQGQLSITDGLSIEGPGASALTIAASTNSRIFNLTENTEISGLTLTGGNEPSTGGAIQGTDIDLTVRDSIITGNKTNAGGGGGIAMAPGGGQADAGSLTLERTTVSGNEATGTGGGIDATSELTLIESTVSGNKALQQGGGIAKRQQSLTFPPGVKFDFGTGPLSITDSTIAGNTAGAQGGGIAIDNNLGNPFGIADASSGKYDVEILRTTVSGNTAPGDGGGIAFDGAIAGPSTVTNSTVAGNTGADGGGIHAGFTPSVIARAAAPAERAEEQPGGSLDVDNTTVAANTATGTGGGIALDEDVEGVDSGGGVRASGDDQVGLNSTIVADNNAPDDNKDLASVQSTGYGSAHGLLETPADATVATDASNPTITGQDPQLAGLAGNGGPTQTKLPAESSPAVDKGNSNGLDTEQRKTTRTRDLATANATGGDGTDIGAVEITPGPTAQSQPPAQPVTPSATPSICGRRAISLIRADRRGSKVKLTGLVGTALYGKTVTIQTDPKGARSSAFTRTTSVKASRTGNFSATVPAPDKDDVVTVRYRAKAGSSTSPALKLPQSLTSRSVKSAKGTITVTGKVKKSVLGRRNRVKIRRLVCGRYRTVGSAKPGADGAYKITFRATEIRGVSLYRAESRVLRKAGSKVYVTQYARAIAIRTTSQTG